MALTMFAQNFQFQYWKSEHQTLFKQPNIQFIIRIIIMVAASCICFANNDVFNISSKLIAICFLFDDHR